MNTNIFDDFDEQSQEETQSNNFLSLEDIQQGFVGNDPFAGIRSNKSLREVTNEIALESPFRERSLLYTPEETDEKIINQPTLAQYIKKEKIDISREQFLKLDANNTFIENIKKQYNNDLLCGKFLTNISVHTYSGVNAAKKRLETYSNNYTWFFEEDPKALNFFVYTTPFTDKITDIVVDIGSDFFDCIKSANISKEEAIGYLIEAFQLSFKKLENKDLSYRLNDLKDAIDNEFKAEEDYQELVNSLIAIFSSQEAVQLVLGLSKEWSNDLKQYKIDKRHYLPEEKDFEPLFFKVVKNELKNDSFVSTELQDYIQDFIEADAHAINAYICGMINAVIDEGKSITELPQFIYNILTNRGTLKTFIRTIKQVLNNKLEFVLKILKTQKELHFNGSLYQFCYQFGYDVGFIMIGVITVGLGKIVKFKNVALFFIKLKKVANNKLFNLAYKAGCAIEVDGKQLILTYNGTIIAKGTVEKLTKKLEKLIEIKRRNPNVGYAFIGSKRLDNLIALRRSHKSLYNANIATMTVRIKETGKPVRVLEFKAQSGPTNKVGGSKKAKERFLNEESNHLDNNGVKRWNDSENKMIRDLEDNYLKGLNIEKVKIEVEIHSIYHPCNKCQQVISNFQVYYNAKVKVFSTEVPDNNDFIKKYPSLSTKNK